MGFINQCFSSIVDNTVTHLVYIWDTNGKQGFYYWNQNKINGHIKILTCSNTQTGYLQIIYCITVPILFDLDFQIREPKLAHENYVKDMYSFENNNCSYTEHMQSIIDHLINLQMSDQGPDGPHKMGTETQSCNSSDRHLKQGVTPHVAVCPSFRLHLSDTFSDVVIHDFNNKHKTKGYLAHQDTKFSFIGPDREPIDTNSLDTYMAMARIIRSTGVSDYK